MSGSKAHSVWINPQRSGVRQANHLKSATENSPCPLRARASSHLAALSGRSRSSRHRQSPQPGSAHRPPFDPSLPPIGSGRLDPILRFLRGCDTVAAGVGRTSRRRPAPRAPVLGGVLKGTRTHVTKVRLNCRRPVRAADGIKVEIRCDDLVGDLSGPREGVRTRRVAGAHGFGSKWARIRLE
jgi:hypothetical protein